jgi:hypothetical protein
VISLRCRYVGTVGTASTFTLVSAALLLSFCTNVRHELPDEIEISDVIASSSAGFFMEGCASVVYRLSERTATQVTQRGQTFIREVDPPRNENPDNAYGDWTPTPVIDPNDTIFALRALGGCNGERGDFHARELRSALDAPGSFYALTSNREGMILVIPRERLAAFLYFG